VAIDIGGKACQKLSIDNWLVALTTMKTLLPPKIQIHLPLLQELSDFLPNSGV